MTQLCGVASHAAPSSSTASQGIDSDVAFMIDVLQLPMPDGATSHSIMSSPPTLPGPKRSRVLAMSRKSTSSSSSASSTHPTSPLGAASTSPPSLSYMNSMPMATTTMTSHPGMKDVPAWLKLLRLHKYTQMFMRLSYDEMMALDEDRLEQLGVTKGARKKILQSVRKLYDRTNELGMLVKDMNGSCPNLRQTIHDLRMILGTPIVAYRPRLPEPSEVVEGTDPSTQLSEINPNNLPGHLCNVAARLHERIVLQKRFIDVDDESVGKLLQVYDRIASHEAFTRRQAECAHSWRKALRSLAMDRGMNGGHGGHHYIKRTPTSGTSTNGFSAGLHRYGSRVSPHGTRSHAIDGSKSTSPPQSSSAPPSLPGASVVDIVDFNRMQSHPEGAKLIDQMINLSLQLESEQPAPLSLERDRRSIAKSLSSPDNSNYYGPLTEQEKEAFYQDLKDRHSLFSEISSNPIKCLPMNIPSSSSSASSTPRFYASPPAPQPLMAQRPDRRCGMMSKQPHGIYSLPPAPTTSTHHQASSYYPTSAYHTTSWHHPNHHSSMAQAQAHRHHSAYNTPALHPHYCSTVLNSQNMPPVN